MLNEAKIKYIESIIVCKETIIHDEPTMRISEIDLLLKTLEKKD